MPANAKVTLSKLEQFPQCTQRLDAKVASKHMKHMRHGLTSDWHAEIVLSCNNVNHHVCLHRYRYLTWHYPARQQHGSWHLRWFDGLT